MRRRRKSRASRRATHSRAEGSLGSGSPSRASLRRTGHLPRPATPSGYSRGWPAGEEGRCCKPPTDVGGSSGGAPLTPAHGALGLSSLGMTRFLFTFSSSSRRRGPRAASASTSHSGQHGLDFERDSWPRKRYVCTYLSAPQERHAIGPRPHPGMGSRIRAGRSPASPIP